MASKGQGITSTDSSAIYYEVSPYITYTLRAFNCVVLLLVLISFVLCLVQGLKDNALYLLLCNLIVSGLIGVVVNYWYRTGDLGAEKYWYIFLVGSIILFQCITSDIYAFQEREQQGTTTTAVTDATVLTPSRRPNATITAATIGTPLPPLWGNTKPSLLLSNNTFGNSISRFKT